MIRSTLLSLLVAAGASAQDAPLPSSWSSINLGEGCHAEASADGYALQIQSASESATCTVRRTIYLPAGGAESLRVSGRLALDAADGVASFAVFQGGGSYDRVALSEGPSQTEFSTTRPVAAGADRVEVTVVVRGGREARFTDLRVEPVGWAAAAPRGATGEVRVVIGGPEDR